MKHSRKRYEFKCPLNSPVCLIVEFRTIIQVFSKHVARLGRCSVYRSLVQFSLVRFGSVSSALVDSTRLASPRLEPDRKLSSNLCANLRNRYLTRPIGLEPASSLLPLTTRALKQKKNERLWDNKTVYYVFLTLLHSDGTRYDIACIYFQASCSSLIISAFKLDETEYRRRERSVSGHRHFSLIWRHVDRLLAY